MTMEEFEEEEYKKALKFIGEEGVKHHIRQLVGLAWLSLPKDERTVENLRSRIQTEVEDAIAELKQNDDLFNIDDDE